MRATLHNLSAPKSSRGEGRTVAVTVDTHVDATNAKSIRKAIHASVCAALGLDAATASIFKMAWNKEQGQFDCYTRDGTAWPTYRHGTEGRACFWVAVELEAESVVESPAPFVVQPVNIVPSMIGETSPVVPTLLLTYDAPEPVNLNRVAAFIDA